MGAQMQRTAKAVQNPSLKSANAGIMQRQCTSGQHAIGGECDECRKKKGILQRAAVNPAPNAVPPIVHEVLRSPGQLLDDSTRAFMEPRFGHDFSRVRVHTDSKAEESAKAVNALAYTVGDKVVFGSGQYAPRTMAGQWLMAHELAHVVQQSMVTKTPQASLIINSHLHSSEQEADAMARQIISKPSPALSKTHRDVSYKPITLQSPQSTPVVQRAVTGTPSAVGAHQLEDFRSLVAQYRALIKTNSLSQEEINEVSQAIDQAEAAIRESKRVSSKGKTLYAGASIALASTAVIAADDATVIGVADDIAIPFTLLAAGVMGFAGWLASSSAKDIQRTGDAARDAVARAIRTIGQILMAQKIGEQVRGLTEVVVIHLARILGTTVSGKPPDHQRDPNRDRPHWWREIKNALQQIRDKGLSPKQLLRELRKRFTQQQLSEIREAIRKVAKLMNEEPPDFPPTAMP